MSVAVDKNGQKWINAVVAISFLLVGVILYRFFMQLNAWFSLEAYISKFSVIAQGLSGVLALGGFVYVLKNEKTSNYIAEVYNELLKVVFPGREITNRHTIIVMIGVAAIGFVLGFFDYIASTLLGLLG